MTRANGGREYLEGAYKYHEFLSSGSLVVDREGEVEVLIVGGGGGGGDSGGGGGGAYYNNIINLPAGEYIVTVGKGGEIKERGENSSFSGITVEGGGAGGDSGKIGANGGCGGGAGGVRYNKGTIAGGSATVGKDGGSTIANKNLVDVEETTTCVDVYTNVKTTVTNWVWSWMANEYIPVETEEWHRVKTGEDCTTTTEETYVPTGGAGGGGASETGKSTNSYLGGDGGDGIPFTTSGKEEYYSGGGGGTSGNRNYGGGEGGKGGGGKGYAKSSPATQGIDGLGGGGGGGSSRGGSGCVYIKYDSGTYVPSASGFLMII